MMKGDLIRCRDFGADVNEWDDIGIVIKYDSLMKTVTAVMQGSGLVKSYRASHAQLVKRAPQNVVKLKEQYKNNKMLDKDST
tara:strand:- start:1620 stop:1865 length:246 start_codon:yes stop_codon:yes gene_type:complete